MDAGWKRDDKQHITDSWCMSNTLFFVHQDCFGKVAKEGNGSKETVDEEYARSLAWAVGKTLGESLPAAAEKLDEELKKPMDNPDDCDGPNLSAVGSYLKKINLEDVLPKPKEDHKQTEKKREQTKKTDIKREKTSKKERNTQDGTNPPAPRGSTKNLLFR
jgi:hypothetical protein